MPIKMSKARASNHEHVTTKTFGIETYEDLICRYCDTPVSFIPGHIRRPDGVVVRVPAHFRLKKECVHTPQCMYDARNQVRFIAKEAPESLIASIENGAYIFRVNIARHALRDAEREADVRFGGSVATYERAEKTLAPYINSAMRVMQLRSCFTKYADLEQALRLVDGERTMRWGDFYFERKSYARLFKKAQSGPTHGILAAVRGFVKSNGHAPPDTNRYAVIDLARPKLEKTDEPGLFDAVCFSIWSADTNAFRNYSVGQDILALGFWKKPEIDRNVNTNPITKDKYPAFLNHDLRMWPTFPSQLCLAGDF